MKEIFLSLSIDAKKASLDAIRTAVKKRKALLAAIEAGIDEGTCGCIHGELEEAKERLADVILQAIGDEEVEDIENKYFKSGSNI